ncbi:MAG: tRNA (guanosine(37)-N1)-methyltransferase TrmD [Oscillospiraceae bacterium]|nr:tRNA (guanosine(37)-N1)-methyltransferase TrmD [Oscillospiraceae bacterium]
MRFDVLTLFPEMMEAIFSSSIVGRARSAGIVDIRCTDIRDYTKDKHRRVDDTPYGGGYGMVMMCQPAVDCIRAVKAQDAGKTRTIYLSPQGEVFTQQKARELCSYDRLILLCGHYEGIDERILELEVDEELSVGDYVLTGGELPAAIVVDCIARLQDGVLANRECYEKESLSDGLLEHPQYTRPRVFEGLEVPEVLVNGNHALQEQWKREQSLERTRRKRPDLLKEETKDE